MDDLIFVLKELANLSHDGSMSNFIFDKVSPQSFDFRVTIQYIMFLVCSKNYNKSPYYFRWYSKGVYSDSLKSDIFDLIDVIKNKKLFNKLLQNNNFTHWSIEIENLQKMKMRIFNEFGRIWNTEDLYILSTLLFCENQTYKECENNKEYTINHFFERANVSDDKKNSIPQYWDILHNVILK